MALHEKPRAGLGAVHFAADDRQAVDGLHAKLKAYGAKITSAPAALAAEAGGGYGFTVISPEGQTLGVSCDVAEHSDVIDDTSRPSCLNHVVLNAANIPEQQKFFCDVLGFKFSDNNGFMSFIRCSVN